MARAAVVRLLLALALAASPAACRTPAADASLAPEGLMTVDQVRAEIEATKARIPLPDGAVWRQIELGEGSYEAYSGGSMVEFQAMCAWLLEARDAAATGDQARRGKALTILEQIPSWRIFTDPKQMDDGTRAMLSGYVASAIEGDFAPAADFLRGTCLG